MFSFPIPTVRKNHTLQTEGSRRSTVMFLRKCYSDTEIASTDCTCTGCNTCCAGLYAAMITNLHCGLPYAVSLLRGITPGPESIYSQVLWLVSVPPTLTLTQSRSLSLCTTFYYSSFFHSIYISKHLQTVYSSDFLPSYFFCYPPRIFCHHVKIIYSLIINPMSINYLILQSIF